MNDSNENPLRYWREKRGLSQRQLAEKTGSTQATISNIESGKRKGLRLNLKKYATCLDIPYSELVSLEETDRSERRHKGNNNSRSDADDQGTLENRAA